MNETTSVERSGVSSREILYGVVGIVLGLLVLSAVWRFSANSSVDQLPNIAEVPPYTAPTFTLKDIDGREVTLDQFKGKVVLLNFWRTDCEPCQRETSALQAAYTRLADQGLVVIGVDLFNDERTLNRGLPEVQAFAAQYNVSYPMVLDETGAVSRSYAINPLPTSYVIDQQGNVRYVKVGELNQSEVERLFRQLQTDAS